MPAKEYYITTTTASIKELEEWYETVKDAEFNFRQEMERYCRDDVVILRRAVLQFRDLYIEATGVDPYEQSATIASACMQVFRRKFLGEKMIGIVPNEGYRKKDRQSAMAIRWLMWVAHSRGIEIQHAKNQGEKRIGQYKVDGYCEALNKVFEFNGKQNGYTE